MTEPCGNFLPVRPGVQYKQAQSREKGNRMRNSSISSEASSPATTESTPPVALSESAAAAAFRLINSMELETLKGRCTAFGIDATNDELLLAGLHLLGQQTETALEVAMLQSLRADRSCAKRRSKR
jgi:hypothetical protein